MRSNSVTKVAKPPPPVPPRPNKTLIAEALAKTRGANNKSAEDNAAPSEPLPTPLSDKENCNGFLPVSKSQSYSSGINDKTTSQVQRSTSIINEKKENSRPVVFQSPNRKLTSKIEVILTRNDSGCDPNKYTKSNVLINLENDKNRECSRSIKNSFRNNNEKNHVNSLIDEMFASILDIPDGGDDENVELPEAYNENVNIPKQNNESPSDNKMQISNYPNNLKISSESLSTDDSKTNEKRIKFDDKRNHEFLISELENMHKENKDQKRKNRPPPLDFSDDHKIHQSDWVEVSNGQEVRLSRCEIIIDDSDVDITTDNIASRLNMSSYGLPPLPKSLSGFSLNPQTPSRITPPNSAFSPSGHTVYHSHPRLSNGAALESPGRNPTNLDNQLAILRREMYSLRQLDLSLLSQLWSLNESIQEFRQMLQEQDDRGLSPPSPSPSPSSCDDGETDEFFSPTPMKLRPAPPPPPLRRTSNSSSTNSSEYGTV